jgi:CRP-like cAMP-binding protein
VPILLGLADEFALEGFAAKAISVLKKIQKLDPARRDVEGKLAKLIKDKARDTPTSGIRPKPVAPELGMEEIGMDAAPVSTPEAPAPEPAAPEPPETVSAEELQPEGLAEFQQQADELVLTPEPEPEPEPAAALDSLGDDLIGMLEDVLKTSPPAAMRSAQAQARANEAPPAVDSPLFTSFSQEELVAVIQGLRLLSFESGDILITEGEAGDSLFVLTSGIVKAFVRNPAGKNVQVREMAEGTFFGEISILSGKPRTATITAKTPCELLELDKATLDSISKTHPHVREVLKQFYEERVKSEQDRKARSGKG